MPGVVTTCCLSIVAIVEFRQYVLWLNIRFAAWHLCSVFTAIDIVFVCEQLVGDHTQKWLMMQIRNTSKTASCRNNSYVFYKRGSAQCRHCNLQFVSYKTTYKKVTSNASRKPICWRPPKADKCFFVYWSALQYQTFIFIREKPFNDYRPNYRQENTWINFYLRGKFVCSRVFADGVRTFTTFLIY